MQNAVQSNAKQRKRMAKENKKAEQAKWQGKPVGNIQKKKSKAKQRLNNEKGKATEKRATLVARQAHCQIKQVLQNNTKGECKGKSKPR